VFLVFFVLVDQFTWANLPLKLFHSKLRDIQGEWLYYIKYMCTEGPGQCTVLIGLKPRIKAALEQVSHVLQVIAIKPAKNQSTFLSPKNQSLLKLMSNLPGGSN